jgi:predicted dehydrogenase
MSSVGVALVGAGPWGLTLARALERAAGSPLRWICELNPARRAHAARLHPESRVNARLDDVLLDPAVVAVAVAVDSAGHHLVGRQVLCAGRHLLLEKPMALSAADASELQTLASERARVLTVDHLLLHHPAIGRIRDLVAAGSVGHVTRFSSTRAVPGPARTPGSSWWTLAPHDVSLALHLLGELPRTVRVTDVRHDNLGHDTFVRAELRFADGRVADIEASLFAPRKTRRLSIVATRASLTFDELDRRRPLVVNGLRDDDPSAPEPSDSCFGDVDPLLAQCRHFFASVARGDAAAGNGPHALDVVRVLEAGARSMQCGGIPVAAMSAPPEAARNVA